MQNLGLHVSTTILIIISLSFDNIYIIAKFTESPISLLSQYHRAPFLRTELAKVNNDNGKIRVKYCSENYLCPKFHTNRRVRFEYSPIRSIPRDDIEILQETPDVPLGRCTSVLDIGAAALGPGCAKLAHAG